MSSTMYISQTKKRLTFVPHCITTTLFETKKRKVEGCEWYDSIRKKIKEETNPVKHLESLFHAHGLQFEITPVLSKKKYFISPIKENYSSYQNDVVTALRQRNLEALDAIRCSGRTLQCRNGVGETLVHMACRMRYTDVVSFLMRSGVSIKVHDEYGRTPMHDAFWTAKPNPELIKLLINEEPALLFMSDKRGHSPLDFARREHWKIWNDFLTDIFLHI